MKKTYITLFALLAVVLASSIQAQDNNNHSAVARYLKSMGSESSAVENPKLADLLPAMTEGGDVNGSTFDAAKPHLAGAQEPAFNLWQQFCFDMGAPGVDPAKVADCKAQMKDALASTTVPAFVKVWLIRQFQTLGNDSDVDAIAAFITSPEYTLRDEAIRTLAKIPGQKSIATLKSAYSKSNDADKQMIQNALEQLTLDVAVQVAETAMPQGIPYVEDAKVAEWVKGYDQLSNELKIQTLAALTVRGDRKYLPVVLSAFEEEGEDADFFKREGLLALEKLGTAAQVPLLVENLKFDRGLVINVASVIESDGFDAALLTALSETSDGENFAALSNILANRNSGVVFAPIYENLQKTDCANRVQLIHTACSVASGDDLAKLIDVLPLFKAGGDRDAAEKALAARCAGNSALVLAKDRDWNVYLPLLGRIGDDPAWNVIDANLKLDAMRPVAIRALCNLPNARQSAKMLTVVEGDEFTPDQKIAALRAYIRVVSLPDDQIGIRASAQDKLNMLRNAMSKVTRVDEKKLILSRLNAIRDVKSAQFAMEFVSDPALEQDVYRAVVELAHHNNVRKSDPNFFGPALDVVIEKCTNADLVIRARKYRDAL